MIEHSFMFQFMIEQAYWKFYISIFLSSSVHITLFH